MFVLISEEEGVDSYIGGRWAKCNFLEGARLFQFNCVDWKNIFST